MKQILSLLFIAVLLAACQPAGKPAGEAVNHKITKTRLQDKIKGGWAGQVIGCTFGGPTEFRFNGTMIQDYQPILWEEGSVRWYYENAPGLYDDVYMDLTFVDVFEKEGLDASAEAHAQAFANAGYMLWHANQSARHNILNGIMPPASGHWLNNPHSDDIDFQIEADFAGLMAPGMVNEASSICDKIGHIMNYGDGWYGGVYVAAMYSLAFISDDLEFIVTEALKTIPAESQFYQCINDVIGWWKMYPADWKQTWFEAERKWSSDVGCPDGIFHSFNIDAKINAAYIVIGLLYGEGDFGRTLDISTRCGQDSDCNPASAGGILGTVLGYENIPDYWKNPLLQVEEMDFRYTTMSLSDVYAIGNKHALEMLRRKGVNTDVEELEIPAETIQTVPLEVGFEGHQPVERRRIGKTLDVNNREVTLEFEGIGFVVTGNAGKEGAAVEAVLQVESSVDGVVFEQAGMATSSHGRRNDVCWKYQLPAGKHQLTIRLKDPAPGYRISLGDLIVYAQAAPPSGAEK